ncbi:LSU ribosomal protein L4P [Abditibacterium utsteinense]|uniref:Large ribosomal subunit protein uL4 n=1 Tax=Abditibacterium utsteinense TaxID=1960156 RepID=A0A2S8ST00_9BACT|nr:50S ribosomal protein L4 [Abditibacterium utsteinense]PQV63944.1 LSU ribosomal protein L4P [Abditibacterium utsteinense]
MADIKIFDGQGQSTGTLQAPDKLSNANAKVTLVHQVMVAELAGARQGTHKVKRRDEVAGSGVKIRRQKGTGRSRQGDKRVPHMRGGGVVHGPVPRDYSQNTPRKMRQSAFRTALNSRLQNDRIFVIDGLSMEKPKTKDFLKLLGTLGLGDYKLLVLTSLGEENIARSGNNLPRVQMQSVNQTGLVDVLKYDAILCTKSAWNELSERVAGKGELE